MEEFMSFKVEVKNYDIRMERALSTPGKVFIVKKNQEWNAVKISLSKGPSYIAMFTKRDQLIENYKQCVEELIDSIEYEETKQDRFDRMVNDFMGMSPKERDDYE
jgi:CRISPR/Cas system CSM-associated protein Csm2 small subunit